MSEESCDVHSSGHTFPIFSFAALLSRLSDCLKNCFKHARVHICSKYTHTYSKYDLLWEKTNPKTHHRGKRSPPSVRGTSRPPAGAEADKEPPQPGSAENPL